MAYSKEVFDAASKRLEQRRQALIGENELMKKQLYKKIPRLAEIENDLAETGIVVAKEIITAGTETKSKIERLRKINLNLQAERAELLTLSGFPSDIINPKYNCSKCKDSGYKDDVICDCFKALLREEACRRANSGSPLPLFEFDSFDTNYYPDTQLAQSGISVRQYMSRVLSNCKNFADSFEGKGGSLMLLGKTGLGKTHLALSIANKVIDKGFGVIYDTAQNIFMRMEEEYFGRSEKNYTTSLFDCDLLIIDDLPEFASNFAVSSFYNLINTRTLKNIPMIVSTNLTENELLDKYGERIFSRLIGDFSLLKFFGNDIRQLKLNR